MADRYPDDVPADDWDDMGTDLWADEPPQDRIGGLRIERLPPGHGENVPPVNEPRCGCGRPLGRALAENQTHCVCGRPVRNACPDCGGAGGALAARIRCERCKGTGVAA